MMTYNPRTKELRDSKGALLKRLNCPLHKRWDELTPSPKESHRQCQSCKQHVHDVTHLTEEELRALLKPIHTVLQPCLYISPRAHHVQILPMAPESSLPCPVRTIKTVFTPEEIQDALEQGFRIKPLSRFHLRGYDVYRNPETGESWVTSDSRCKIHFEPDRLKKPTPAYVLPLDLAVGERVYFSELIGVPYVYHGFAHWDGKHFRVEDLLRKRLLGWSYSWKGIG